MEKKIYFLLAPIFLELPNKIKKNLEDDGFKINISGLVSGSKKDFKKSQIFFNNVKFLNDLEKKFLSTKYDLLKVQRFREMFGDEVLNNIIIADRNLGQGYVTGSEKFPTKLAKFMQKDNLAPIIYVVELLDFLLNEFKNLKPDFIFCYAIAGAPSLAIAIVAKYLGIKFATFVHTRVQDRVNLDTSHDFSLQLIAKKYRDNSDKDIKIGNEAAKYLQNYRNSPIKPSYEDVNEKLFYESNSYLNFFKNVTRFVYHKFKSLFINESFHQSHKNIYLKLKATLKIKFQNNVFDKVNLKNKFVYFPLHVDPEASTMVMSPMHTDQISIIEAISKSVPFDTFVYVKEHIYMWGKRPKDFYNKIKSFPKVKLVHPLEKNFFLIKSAFAVTTITGTSGWEGMLLKKPVIFFGNSPFLALNKGFILCKGLSNLPSIFKNLDNFEYCNDEDLLKYLTILFENSFSMSHELLWGDKNRSLAIKKNNQTIQRISDEFKKFLR